MGQQSTLKLVQKRPHHSRSLRRLKFTIKIKEPFSAFSHLFGVPMAIAALSVLVTYAALERSIWHVIAFSIYGACMIMVYVASTLYHWLPLKPSQEKLFRSIDQTMIYFMIAGTYTPVGLVTLNGMWSITMLSVIWGLALIGIILLWHTQLHLSSRLGRRKANLVHTMLYLSMGWISVFYAKPIMEVFPASSLAWIIGGGIFYSVGAVVYGLRWPNPIPRVIGAHEIFHLFVLLGTICHFLFMLLYVLPAPAA